MPLIYEDLIPDYNFRIDSTGDLDKFANQIIQPALDLACSDASRWRDQNNVDKAEEFVVDAMLDDLGNPFEVVRSLSIQRKRLLVRSLVQIYKTRGTPSSVVDVVRALTGLEVVAVESPGVLPGWRLGVEELNEFGDDPPADPENTSFAILGRSDKFLAYSFRLEFSVTLTSEQKEIIEEVVRFVKPAHVHFVGFIEPATLVPIDHVELGFSQLDLNFDLH